LIASTGLSVASIAPVGHIASFDEAGHESNLDPAGR
jgi:hypothetical protein